MPDLIGKFSVFRHWLWYMLWSVVNRFNYIEGISINSNLLSVLIINRLWILSKFFLCIYWYDHIFFSFCNIVFHQILLPILDTMLVLTLFFFNSSRSCLVCYSFLFIYFSIFWLLLKISCISYSFSLTTSSEFLKSTIFYLQYSTLISLINLSFLFSYIF